MAAIESNGSTVNHNGNYEEMTQIIVTTPGKVIKMGAQGIIMEGTENEC